MKRGKRYRNLSDKIDANKKYSIDEALQMIPELNSAKFDESVDVAIRLGVDPRKADQMVRGTVILPKGTGKKVKILVIAKGEKEKEARDAGADYAGAEDIIEKIAKGWLEFDRVVATPDMMGGVGKLGKILGPRGLMPNPKVGTVTFDVARAVNEIRKGKVDYKVDKSGNLHASIGKVSFGYEAIKENAFVFIGSVLRAKPSGSKGTYLRGISFSTTMGPSINVDPLSVRELV
ncbi:MAG: 50S ribosomal protein L1 [Thermodesulfobacteriota bacterium]